MYLFIGKKTYPCHQGCHNCEEETNIMLKLSEYKTDMYYFSNRTVYKTW